MMVPSSEMIGLSAQFDRILNKMDSVDKSARDFGSGDLLYRSEIHTIMAVCKNPGANVTSLAEYFGITKSAVSQMVNRLSKKNLIEKYRNEDNEKEIYFRLTPRGMIAFLGHEQYHMKIHARIEEKLREMTGKEFGILKEFFCIIEETADESLRDAG